MDNINPCAKQQKHNWVWIVGVIIGTYTVYCTGTKITYTAFLKYLYVNLDMKPTIRYYIYISQNVM